jgi:CopG family transcriptional regulator, nickel-responsive regulator
MAIISVSLNEKVLKDIDKLQKELGFSGRSEVIRAASRMLVEDSREKAKLAGTINGILLVVHNQDAEHVISKIKHQFEDIIKTQIHNHLKEEKCLEIFILEGDAARVRSLLNSLRTSRKVDYLKLIVS